MTAEPRRVRAAPFGLTLVEVLAVVLILSLAAGLATFSLAASSEAARLHAAISQWRDLDARARLHGRIREAVTMSLNDEGTAVRLHAIGSPEPLALVELPAGFTGQVRADPDGDSVTFDRRGRSADYQVELIVGNRTMRWQVLGISGLVEEVP